MATNAERQAGQVRCLEIPPHPGDLVTEFRVEQWAGDHLFVTRRVRRYGAKACERSQGFRVGPRGGLKVVFDSFVGGL